MNNIKYQCAECGALIEMVPSKSATSESIPIRTCEHTNAAISAFISATATGESRVAA